MSELLNNVIGHSIISLILCVPLPIAIMLIYGWFRENSGAKIFDYIYIVLMVMLYSLLFCINDIPKSFENWSFDTLYITISLIIFSLSRIFKSKHFVVSLLFSIIPVIVIIYSVFFTKPIYE